MTGLRLGPRLVHGRRLDDTIAWRRDPYRLISRRAARAGQDVVEIRLLLRRTSCLTGADAARLFYDETRFQRAGAAPEALRATLFGTGGVQGLDGAEHRRRKAMFLEINRRDRVEELAQVVRREWRSACTGWSGAGEVDLYAQVRRLLTRAVCEWAAVPLPESEVQERTDQLSALFDDAATVGLGHLRSRVARRRAEAWAERVILAVRDGTEPASVDTAAGVIAAHRDADGRLLAPRVAAVELLNILRPTVACAVYVVFVAHALDAHPSWRLRLAQGDGSEDLAFVEEVRRHYPFFPAVTAVARQELEWRGHTFPKGRRVLLDLYGTNHDPALWHEPDRFDPERFLGTEPDPFAFVPQGGGDPAMQHRCPGEPVSTRVMEVVLDELTRRMGYRAVQPSGPVDFRRLPALPRHGYRVVDVVPSERVDLDERVGHPSTGSHGS